MGLFDKPDAKFVKLVGEIDRRLKLYEMLVKEGSEPHPPGLELVFQEFRNLKIRAWSIETGDNKAVKLIKELNSFQIMDELKKEGKKYDGKRTEGEIGESG